MEVYGINKDKKRITHEDDIGYLDPLSIRSSYSEGKRLCECLCSSYISEYGLNIVIGRLAQVFGVGVTKNDSRIFCQFARSVINKENIVLHTKGKSEGNYVYTFDAVEAILLLLQKGENNEVYNIVNEGSHSTIKGFAEMAKKQYASSSIDIIYDIPDDISKYGYAPDVKMKLSSKKLNKLGWIARTNLKDSFERMIESMK